MTTSGNGRCPSCGEELRYRGQYPAVSRTDNETEVCSFCGQAEAFADFYGIPYPEWPIEGRAAYAAYLLDHGAQVNVLELEEKVADFVERGGVEPPSPAS